VSAPQLASVDGGVGLSSDATVAVTDEGLLRGDGVFEVIRLYAGRPFALVDHLDRLGRSAAAIQLAFDRAALEREIEALLRAFGTHGGGDGQLRLVITRGGRRIALTETLPDRGGHVRLATVTYSPSVILTGVKSLSYAANMQATRLAQTKLADEAVLVRPDGIVLEAPTSTLFWASDGDRLRTPSIKAGILESITRSRLIHELDVEEGEWELPELEAASEAFLASTTREVQPVASIDGRELEAPGPATERAQRAFARIRDAELG
jgi:branched-chain amino acid aminotransferase